MASLSIRGLMLDAARLVELPQYYRRFIDFCADWGINAVIFRLTDDQGCAIRFRGRPELLTHENALEPAQMAELARYAQQRGVELIPEIESFGHSVYVTSVPAYAGLCDRDAKGIDWAQALIPLHPQVLEILSDLYREAAELFPGRFLHGGCDEVNWGGSEFSRSLLKQKSRAQVWAGHLNELRRIAGGCGKELIVWGDHVLRKEPEILDHLDRQIIIHDWEYETCDPAPLVVFAERALSKGFRVIGGPALTWCRWGPRIGRGQLFNVDAYADAYRRIQDERALGVIVTNWVPGRYVPDAIWDELAYAAVAVNEGTAAARETALARFVERHFGAAWDERWSDIFHTLYAAAENRTSCSPPWLGPTLPRPWASEEELRQILTAGRRSAPPFRRLRGQLEEQAATVKRNQDDFQSLRLVVAYLEHVYWRQAAPVEAMTAAREQDSRDRIRRIARKDAELLAELEREWNRSRAPNAWQAAARKFGIGGEDALLWKFAQAAEFSAALAQEPNRFSALLRKGQA